MKHKLGQYWNYKPLGLIIALPLIFRVAFVFFIEKLISYYWSLNLGSAGKRLTIQVGGGLRQPRNIHVGNDVSIGRNVSAISEFGD